MRAAAAVALLPLPRGAAAAAPAHCADGAELACSLNGVCVLGQCLCDAAWGGERCDVLVRLPADPAGGLHSPHDPGAPRGVSAWGGGVVRGDDGAWHMYAAEMTQRCGIEWWEPNSRVVHAVSAVSAAGPYRVAGVVAPRFAHEPNVMRAPTGEYVILMTMRHPADWPADGTATVDCDGPQTPTPAPPVPLPCKPPPPRHTYMTWSRDPDGPWAEPVLVLKANTSLWSNCSVLIDTNLAGTILPNGTLVGIWRKCVNEAAGKCAADCCTFPRLLTAADWRDPATYLPHSDVPLFPDLAAYGAEDPYVYQDGKGRFHAILHDEQGAARSNSRGRHAFSVDGVQWHYSAADAYDGAAALRGGGTLHFERRERPHLVLDARGRPTHLSNGVQEVGVEKNCSQYAQCFRSYTFVQPLGRAAA